MSSKNNEKDNKKVYPCPFCGGEAKAEMVTLLPHMWRVRCTGCGAQSTRLVEIDAVVESWNRRAA